jgi:predicted alpha/beta hydrolase
MTIGIEVRFRADDEIELGAWLYLPKRGTQRYPAIMMAPGYAGVKERSITRFAEACAGAGFLVLLQDYRTFVASRRRPMATDQCPKQLLYPGASTGRRPFHRGQLKNSKCFASSKGPG